MTTTKTTTKFTNVPQWLVDQCLSRRDEAYHELDTLAVYLDVQLNSLELTIEKLNSTEIVRYSLH